MFGTPKLNLLKNEKDYFNSSGIYFLHAIMRSD